MLKKIIIILNQILLAICFTGLIITVVMFNTIGNKKYLLSILERNNYYEQIYHNSKSTLEGYTIQLGLVQEALDTLYTEEKVKKDIITLVDGIYDNKEVIIDTQEITDKLDEIINNKLAENNRTPSAEEQKSIQEFKETITEVYETEIMYSKKYITKLQSIYTKINNLKNKAIALIGTITLFLTITLSILTNKTKTKLKSISISLLSSGLLLISPKLLLESKFQHILILNSIFSKLLIFLINDIFKILFISGIIFSIISIIGMIIGVKTPNNPNQKS